MLPSLMNPNLYHGEGGVVMDVVRELEYKVPMDYVPKFIFDQGGVLAGGSLLRMLLGKFDPEDCDLDIWVPELNKHGNTNSKINYMKRLLKRHNWEKSDKVVFWDLTEQYSLNRIQREEWMNDEKHSMIDLITHSFDEVIEEFDINMCMIGYSHEKGLYWNQHFVEGLISGTVRNIKSYPGYNRYCTRRNKYMKLLGKEWKFEDMHAAEDPQYFEGQDNLIDNIPF